MTHRIWTIAYIFCVALGFGVTRGLPGAAAPMLLTIGLPAALAQSRVREDPSFPTWLLAVLPSALALWLVAGDSGSVSLVALLATISVLGTTLLLAGRPKSPRFAPLAAIALLVFLVAFFSSAHGGSGAMLRWFLTHGLNDSQAHTATLAFRKTVHFTFYGSLGWAASRASLFGRIDRLTSARTALSVVLVVASFDELRQSAYANRTGSAWDVLLDLSGAATIVGLSLWSDRKTALD